ncbi:MAG: AEC family transporter [Phycisphaerae bacterium]
MAISVTELPARLGEIFYTVILPMLLLSGIGFVIRRFLGLDMPTLTRLNFYFVTPGMVYFSVVSAKLTAGEVGLIIAASLVTMALVAAVTILVARLEKVPRDQHNAMLMTTVLNNSGNIGLPLQDLAFRGMGLGAAAMSYQVFAMLVQNVSHFTLGVVLAAGKAQRPWKENLLHVAKFPPLYALAVALITVFVRNQLGEHAPAAAKALAPFWEVVNQLRLAYVPVALVALGAQLALIPHGADHYPVPTSLILRLVVSPLLMLALIYALNIHGFLAQVLLIGSAAPSSVNSALLCSQFDNHPNYVAKTVFYSTLLSAVTMTLVIFLAQGGFLKQLALN